MAEIDRVGTSSLVSNHDAISFEAPASALVHTSTSRHRGQARTKQARTRLYTRPVWNKTGRDDEVLLQLSPDNPFLRPATEPCNLTLAAQALLDLSRVPDRPRPNRVLGHNRDFVFSLPLGSDHLIVVTQFNVLRGLLSNMAALHRLDELQARYPEEAPPLFPVPSSESEESCSTEDFVLFSSSSTRAQARRLEPVPIELMPTELQRSTTHGSWIDYCPSGAMRDNIIRHEQELDHLQLMRDILGSVCDSGPGGEEGCGLIVWQDPWSPAGWELTEGFARKWWFLVAGCDDLLASTNRWRGMRGEEPLVVEV